MPYMKLLLLFMNIYLDVYRFTYSGYIGMNSFSVLTQFNKSIVETTDIRTVCLQYLKVSGVLQ